MSTLIENDVLKGCTVATNEDKSITFYIKDGKVVAECRKTVEYGEDIERWYNADGKKHRNDDLPAVIWYKNGQKTKECWYRDGKLHRDGDQPAVIHYKNGQKIREYWYRDGVEYVPEKPKNVENRLAEIEAFIAKITECLAKIREETAKQ